MEPNRPYTILFFHSCVGECLSYIYIHTDVYAYTTTNSRIRSPKVKAEKDTRTPNHRNPGWYESQNPTTAPSLQSPRPPAQDSVCRTLGRLRKPKANGMVRDSSDGAVGPTRLNYLGLRSLGIEVQPPLELYGWVWGSQIWVQGLVGSRWDPGDTPFAEGCCGVSGKHLEHL